MPTTLRLPRFTLAMAACLLLATPVPAKESDRCEIDINSIDRIEPTAEYDPYGGNATGYHTIELEHDDGPACALLVGIDDGGNGGRIMDSSKDRLVYDLYKDSRLSQRVGDIRGNESNMFALQMDKKNDEASIQVFSNIPGGQLVPKGTYSDRVTVNVYQLIDGIPVGPIASRTAQVRTKVRTVVTASVIVNGVTRPLNGSVGTLDLGDLTRGSNGRFDLDISGNGDYSLSLSSENGGRLVTSGGGGINYQLYVAGRAVSLSRGTNVDLGGAGRYEMRVETGTPGQVLAGTYQDNLLLTITAN
ncbi:spore coat protein U domain-containing protein [Niveispirillum sp. KHB5.9]|uniref:spore coat protein U domain-containing protein n=1 Tax=Niveispirillum sp. KHB5.9 TaxID=3400269 RepID=UPI003A862612